MSSPGPFSKNSTLTLLLERIPLIGQITAGVLAITGNTDEAWRALWSSSKFTVVTAAAVWGFTKWGIVGGVAGAVLSYGGLIAGYVMFGYFIMYKMFEKGM